MLSPDLEQTRHRALSLASERRHEYATLEHLLLALADDKDAATVLHACRVDLDKLRSDLCGFLDEGLATDRVALTTDRAGDPIPTIAGFRRVMQRAAIHVQSSGHDEVSGADVLVALFSEHESHAVYFLKLQDMTRLDAVDFIAHGMTKSPRQPQQQPGRDTLTDPTDQQRRNKEVEDFWAYLNEQYPRFDFDALNRTFDEEWPRYQSIKAHKAREDAENSAKFNIIDGSKKGDLERVKTSIDFDPGLVSTSYDGYSPLMFAAENGHKDAVELLLANNADVNGHDPSGRTALHAAAERGHRDVVQSLLINHAHVNAVWRDGYLTPLSLGVKNDHADVVALLRQHGGSLYGGGIHEAASKGNLGDVWALLDKIPNLAFSRDDGEYTPLHEAARAGHREVAELLLAYGADVNATANNGMMPLHEAGGRKEIVELLLANKADVNARCKWKFYSDGDNATPLHHVAESGSEAATALMLAYGADVNAKDKKERTPLHNAAAHGRKGVVALLLANNADVNAKDKRGWTPLHIAVSYGWLTFQTVDVVALLLANKADVNARSTHGWTPLHVAAAHRHLSGALPVSVAELLLANNADINARDNRGWTPSRVAWSLIAGEDNNYIKIFLADRGGE